MTDGKMNRIDNISSAEERLEQMEKALNEALWMAQSEKHDKEVLIKANRELQSENDNLVTEIQSVIEETQELENENQSLQKSVEHWKNQHYEVAKDRDSLLDAINEQNLRRYSGQGSVKAQELEERIQQVRMEERRRIKVMFAEHHRLEEEMEQIQTQKTMLESEVERLQKLLLLTKKANQQQSSVTKSVIKHDLKEPVLSKSGHKLMRKERLKRNSAPEMCREDDTRCERDATESVHNSTWLDTAKDFFAPSSSFSSIGDRSNRHISIIDTPEDVFEQEVKKGILSPSVSVPIGRGSRPLLNKSASSRTVLTNSLLGEGVNTPRWSLATSMFPRIRQNNNSSYGELKSIGSPISTSTSKEENDEKTSASAASINRRRRGVRRSSIDDNGFESVRAAAMVAAGSLNYLPESWISDEEDTAENPLLPSCTPLQISSDTSSTGPRSLRDALSKEPSFRRTSAMTDAAIVIQATQVGQSKSVDKDTFAPSSEEDLKLYASDLTKKKTICGEEKLENQERTREAQSNEELSLADVIAQCNVVNARESRRRSQVHAGRTSFMSNLATLHSYGQLSESMNNFSLPDDDQQQLSSNNDGMLAVDFPMKSQTNVDSVCKKV